MNDLSPRSDALDAFLASLPDDQHVSVSAAHPSGELVYAHDADRLHYAASTMKTWLVAAAYRLADAGELDLDAPVPIHPEFGSAVDGSPFSMQQDYDNDDEVWRRVGETVSLRWLCLRTIVRSSNLATNLVLQQVGVEAVTDTMRAFGLQGSQVQRGIEDWRARDAGLTNLVSASDLVRTYQHLISGNVLTRASSDELLAVHGAQQSYDGLPGGFGADTRIAHKSGWVDGSTHDAGVVTLPQGERFVVAVCTTTPEDVDGHDLVRRAGRGLRALLDARPA